MRRYASSMVSARKVSKEEGKGIYSDTGVPEQVHDEIKSLSSALDIIINSAVEHTVAASTTAPARVEVSP